ncbi:hypothetical protein HYPSUDRAFT_187495 [Hypholoma sublateritium FD-334 SS-4]|uniref:DUF5648 domain-containing protein n=1 Tax=Hypholoma sublateritium (strain FD-334 SS-4) TaxID=945553 RepID=A0A0D2L3S9_HYPSF|nr:hypothetical protein HYPSUDRAFT_187495 [Hypholoma sublateritium FD-334 SS-4]
MTRHSVPLHRLYSTGGTDHFYTASQPEANNAANVDGYTVEGSPCNIFTQQYEGTVPLYRMYNGAIVDHFYTTNAAEKDNAITKLGYSYEGVTGYVYPDASCEGGRPLYRLYSQGATDHFYTSDAAERDKAMTEGYANEGIAAYAPPATG